MIAKITLFEGGLNDDYLEVDTKTKKVVLYYYTYANAWGNNEHRRKYRIIDDAIEWYKRHFRDRAIYQGRVWLTEGCAPEDYPEKDEDDIVVAPDSDAMDEWETLTLYCEID